MSHRCRTSSRLTLSVALRSVFRAELAPEFRFRPGSSLYGHSGHFAYLEPSRSCRQLGSKRCFGSLSSLQSSQSRNTQSASNGSQVTSTAPSSTDGQQNTLEGTEGIEDIFTGAENNAAPETVKIDSAESASVTGAVNEKSRKGSTKAVGPKEAVGSEKHKHRSKEKTPRPPKEKKAPEGWRIQKEALKRKFKEGWNPHKRLSPDAMEGIRHLYATAPDKFTTPVLAERFEASPEAIRRILKSRWRPSEEDMEARRARWQTRNKRIWSHMFELGLRRPRRRYDASSSEAHGALYGDKDQP